MSSVFATRFLKPISMTSAIVLCLAASPVLSQEAALDSVINEITSANQAAANVMENLVADDNIAKPEVAQAAPLVDSSSVFAAMSQLLGEGQLGLSDAETSTVRDFYAGRSDLVFTVDTTTRHTIESAMDQVEEHGLPASRYEFAQIASIDDAMNTAFNEITSAAFLVRYGRDMERGLIAPKSLGSEFDFTPTGRSGAELLSAFANASDKTSMLRELEPNDPDYPKLKAELAKLRALKGDVANVDAPKIDDGPTLRLGDQSDRVAQLRARLSHMGFEPSFGEVISTATVVGTENAIVEPNQIVVSAAPFDPSIFDAGLLSAVEAYQSEAGIAADGIVGPATIAMMNRGPEDRLKSLLVGMERHRWGPQNRNGRQIYVNIANFMAEIRDNNVKSFETVVVVGKAQNNFRTPEFNDTMTHLIVNPKWNVPTSISVKEYLPKLKRDPGVLARQNIKMRIRGSGQEVDPRKIDMSQFTVNDFPFTLQQQSGDDNALGNVKFMFPNRHAIYLHDTQAKSLFSRSLRAYSHGCVRVRDPEDFATMLLAPQINDPRGTYRSYLASGKERRVNLDTHVPIHLTYFTAYVGNAGTVKYATDVYGRDRLLWSSLSKKGVSL